jgi:hypothetical protein
MASATLELLEFIRSQNLKVLVRTLEARPARLAKASSQKRQKQWDFPKTRISQGTERSPPGKPRFRVIECIPAPF